MLPRVPDIHISAVREAGEVDPYLGQRPYPGFENFTGHTACLGGQVKLISIH